MLSFSSSFYNSSRMPCGGYTAANALRKRKQTQPSVYNPINMYTHSHPYIYIDSVCNTISRTSTGSTLSQYTRRKRKYRKLLKTFPLIKYNNFCLVRNTDKVHPHHLPERPGTKHWGIIPCFLATIKVAVS